MLNAMMLKGMNKSLDARNITPELQARLDAAAVNPASASPMESMYGSQTTRAPISVGGGGFTGKLGKGLGSAFAASASSNPGGRIVS